MMSVSMAQPTHHDWLVVWIIFYFSTSSQLTKSYFSEGLLNDQPAIIQIPIIYPLVRIG